MNLTTQLSCSIFSPLVEGVYTEDGYESCLGHVAEPTEGQGMTSESTFIS